ncbi:MAG: CBS domain-containing protein [Verrucomicrobiales bacterium]|nr:CBS domain-containing protein [Verrucomicrobiales bacterium]
MRKQTGSGRGKTFTDSLKAYESSHRFGEAGDFLRMVAGLRNVIIHEKVKPHLQLAIPTETVVTRLELLAEEITNPPRVFPVFQTKVERIQMKDSLREVLALVEKRDYSQFPVYREDRFQGLLTENGITRWLASQVTNTLSLVDFEEATIQQIIKQDDNRRNYRFVDRDCTISRAEQIFRDHELLEAIFITQNSKKSESLLGIITRWDILHRKT